jgi:16S rRNA A1518/A1519 N6-dimethyltransferase RsmA/KsgA/DIM1 with predicted DNA glycosylase/AP lyase activity
MKSKKLYEKRNKWLKKAIEDVKEELNKDMESLNNNKNNQTETLETKSFLS